MATVYFTGEADAVAQIATGSIDSVDATPSNNTFTVTIGGVAISQTGDTDVATTTTALVALLNASTHPYFAAVTWTNPSAGNITGTADTAGVPFVAALTETGAGTGAVTDFSDDTASAGPNDWSTAGNWSDGAVPVNSDDVIIEGVSTNILWGLAQSAVTLDSITVRRSFTGRIGLDQRVFTTSANGETTNAAKPEYRGHYLDIGFTRGDIGQHIGPGNPNGSRRIKLDNAKAGASTLVVYDTATTSAETGFPAFRYLAANSAADVIVRGATGGAGIAMDEPAETSTVGAVSVRAGSVFIGPGVTFTSLAQAGGAVVAQAAATVTSMEIDAGTLTTEGDYTVTTLNANGGNVFCNHIKTSGNAVTTMNINGGVVDGRQSQEARTWATVNADLGTLLVDDAVVTITTFDQPAGVRQVQVT